MAGRRHGVRAGEAAREGEYKPRILALARLLAQRLNAATSYLVDLNQQLAGHETHLAMVGEVLQSLMCQQYEEITPGSDRAPGP